MAFSKITDIQELSTEQIEEKILEIKKDLIDLKIKQVTKQSIKSHIFKHKKHALSQLLMYKHQNK